MGGQVPDYARVLSPEIPNLLSQSCYNFSMLPRTDIWNRKPVSGAVLGAAVVVIFGWLMYAPDGLLGKADAIGYAVCHRIDLRSFHLGSRPVSLCARCTGMYLGAVLGLFFLSVRAPRRGGSQPLQVNIVLGLLALAFALDGLNSFTNLIPGFPSLYQTSNAIRIFTGTGFGIVMAVFVYPAFNQTVWVQWDRRPAVGSLRQLAPLLLIGILTAAVVLSENAMILYPASFISAGGVVVLLTMVYTMLVSLVFKRENFASSPRELFTPMLLGLTIAMLQITGADVLRFLLTGTWEGFHFG